MNSNNYIDIVIIVPDLGKLCGLISNSFYTYMCRLFNDGHNIINIHACTVVYIIIAYN